MNKKSSHFSGLQFLAFSALGMLILVGAFACNPMNSDASIYESPAFLTASEARKHIAVSLPDEATNIRFAGYREWIAADDYLRFEAPVDVCLKHAAVMMPKSPLQQHQDRSSSAGTHPSSLHLKDLSWFDLKRATNVVSARDGMKALFIDQDRGVFYYRFTD